MANGIPSLKDVDSWFDKNVLPLRTASAGLSWNRVYKSPHRLVAGNQSDPNGLCGDTSSYVTEVFEKAFPKANPTSDGFMLGMVLWEGLASNHIANVMLPQEAAHKQSFESKAGVIILREPATGALGARLPGSSRSKTRILGATELLGLHVYDLYYKKRGTVSSWWDVLSSSRGGLLTVGMEHEFT
jgi:hypothetical protein